MISAMKQILTPDQRDDLANGLDPVTGLPPSIKTALERNTRERDEILAHVASATDADALAVEFYGLHASAFVASCCAYLEVTVDKIDQAADVLRRFSAMGYRCGERHDRVNDVDQCVWTVRHEDGRHVYFQAHLSGRVCKFVKVGETMKPVYELQCAQDSK